METLKIAVTGASGFVGANLVEQMGRKHNVYALSRKTDNWRLNSVKENVEFSAVALDVSDRENTFDAMRKIAPDAVLHCATYGGYHYQSETKAVIDTDVFGSLNVIAACSKQGIDLINTGSSSEYGVRQSVMKETDVVAPNTDYAMAKALMTNLLGQTKQGMTLRLFSVYGYYEEPHRLIPTLIKAKIKNETAVLSDKNNVRDFIFVEDIARAYECAIKNYDKCKGEVFNVGSGVQVTIGDVVELLGLKVKWNAAARAKEEKRVWQADISKTRLGLGWQPEVSLADGLAKNMTWMEKHAGFYEGKQN